MRNRLFGKKFREELYTVRVVSEQSLDVDQRIRRSETTSADRASAWNGREIHASTRFKQCSMCPVSSVGDVGFDNEANTSPQDFGDSYTRAL